jgi:hypothetical protein
MVSSRRGRPKLNRPLQDLGTPESREKNAQGLTEEPIDMCLKNRYITESQHSAGIRFRWLYTVRFGLPTVQAVDTSSLKGRDLSAKDDVWQEAREKEYKKAIECLKKRGCLPIVEQVCIYNIAPHFLRAKKPALALDSAELKKLREGLLELTKLLSFRHS